MFPHTTVGAAARLIEMMGIDRQTYLDKTWRMNVWHDGDRGLTKHEAIPRLDGMFAYAQQMEPTTFLFIVVGRNAMEVMPKELQSMKFGETRNFLRNAKVIYMPHTSGRNRLWNNGHFAREITAKLQKQVEAILGRPE